MSETIAMVSGPIWCSRCWRQVQCEGVHICSGCEDDCQGYPCPSCGAQHKWQRGEQPKPSTEETLRDLRHCASLWEPQACLLGNVRAGDIVRALDDTADLRARLTAALLREAALREALEKVPELRRRAVEWGMTPVALCRGRRLMDNNPRCAELADATESLEAEIMAALAATPDEALAEVRREAAEAMRERCVLAACHICASGNPAIYVEEMGWRHTLEFPYAPHERHEHCRAAAIRALPAEAAPEGGEAA